MKIDSWAPSRQEVLELTQQDEILAGEPLKPCGCGVKLDLNEIVYPVLEESRFNDLIRRVDSAPVSGRLKYFRRILGDIHDKPEIESSIKSWPDSLVSVNLVSLNPSFYENPLLTKSVFRHAVDLIFNMFNQVSRHHKNIFFSKAHSIEGGGDFFLLDLFSKISDNTAISHLNNDTIVTADSLIKSSSKISVFTSLNNALNDLFVCGVVDDLEIYPVIDGPPEDDLKFQGALNSYQIYYREQGVNISILPIQKLNKGLSLIGATVVGVTDRIASSFSCLQPDDEIIITRKLGDLSALALYRSLWLDKKSIPENVKELRLQVLRWLMTSQYELGVILKKYRPRIGEAFDPNQHISFSTDISGPGLSVLEEAAELSLVDIQIENLNFYDTSLLNHYRRNHTSSTNGPMMIAGRKPVLSKLKVDFESIGMSDVWSLGRVVQKSTAPTVWLAPNLEFLKNEDKPRFDFFNPEVHFSNEKRRIPIFKRMKFGRI